MTINLEQIYSAATDRFGAVVKAHGPETSLYLTTDQYIAAMTAFKDEFGFDRLSDITAVDYWPETQPRFHLIIHLHNHSTQQRLAVRLPVNAAELTVTTLTSIYINASWYEREVADLFGILFDGHPDPRRIIMPQDWQGHPLRKDYPLGYEEVQFTFNFEKINAKKIFGKG